MTTIERFEIWRDGELLCVCTESEMARTLERILHGTVKHVIEHPDPCYSEATIEFVTEHTGATRGTDLAGFPLWLLPIRALKRWSKAFQDGLDKGYGLHNWLRGFKMSGLITHAIMHLYQYLWGDRSEDHLGHAMWNIGAAIEMEETRPELCDTLTKEMLDELKNHQQHVSENRSGTVCGTGEQFSGTGIRS